MIKLKNFNRLAEAKKLAEATSSFHNDFAKWREAQDEKFDSMTFKEYLTECVNGFWGSSKSMTRIKAAAAASADEKEGEGSFPHVSPVFIETKQGKTGSEKLITILTEWTKENKLTTTVIPEAELLALDPSNKIKKNVGVIIVPNLLLDMLGSTVAHPAYNKYRLRDVINSLSRQGKLILCITPDVKDPESTSSVKTRGGVLGRQFLGYETPTVFFDHFPEGGNIATKSAAKNKEVEEEIDLTEVYASSVSKVLLSQKDFKNLIDLLVITFDGVDPSTGEIGRMRRDYSQIKTNPALYNKLKLALRKETLNTDDGKVIDTPTEYANGWSIAKEAIKELHKQAQAMLTLPKTTINDYINTKFAKGQVNGKTLPTPWPMGYTRQQLEELLKLYAKNSRTYSGDIDFRADILLSYQLFCLNEATVYCGIKEYVDKRLTRADTVVKAIRQLTDVEKVSVKSDLCQHIKSIVISIPRVSTDEPYWNVAKQQVADKWKDAESNVRLWTSNTPGGIIEGKDYTYRYDSNSSDTHYNFWQPSAVTTFDCTLQDLQQATQTILTAAIAQAKQTLNGAKEVSDFKEVCLGDTFNNLPFVQGIVTELFDKNLHFYNRAPSGNSIITPKTLNGEGSDYSDALISDVVDDSNADIVGNNTASPTDEFNL